MRDEANVSRRHALLGVATLAAGGVASPALAQLASGCGEAETAGVWWNELVAADPVQARAFYSKIMGWTAKVTALEDNSRAPNPGEEEYTVFLQNGQEIAGLTKLNDGEPDALRPGWVPYVQVASVDGAVAETLKSGGKVLRYPTDVAKVGRLAIITDLAGTPVGLVEPVVSTPG